MCVCREGCLDVWMVHAFFWFVWKTGLGSFFALFSASRPVS
jgi:hypothetical protein